MRQTSDTLAFFKALEEQPYNFDFFQVLRQIECLYPDKPRIGQALRPIDEPVRLGQTPALTFSPGAVSAFVRGHDSQVPRVEVNFFGLLGPNGPLPLHLTEYARERLMHSGDASFARFLDVLHHRFLALFYRAWAQAQPTVNLDRPTEDRFAQYIGTLFGLSGKRLRGRDDVEDYAKLFYVNALTRQVRNRDGLTAILRGYFAVPVRIEEFVGHWMDLAQRDRARLGEKTESVALGRATILGARIWDRQSKIRIWLGPLSLAQYEDFLPGCVALKRLVVWLRQYLCFELGWDVRLVLRSSEIPKLRLGNYGRLGLTTWLGKLPATTDAADLILDADCQGAGR